MKRILITGRNGFLGGAVARRLSEFPDRYEWDFLSLRRDDWRNADLSGYDCVLHLAGLAHASQKKSMIPLYRSVNRDLTLEIARMARAAGVPQFVFLSSSIVFGPPSRAGRPFVITPETTPNPKGAYALSKFEAECGLRAMETEGFRVAILRPMMVYGPGCKGNYNRLRGLVSRMNFFPDFSNLRGAIYVESLVELILRIIQGGQGGIYHPQDEFVAATADFVREIARFRGKTMHFTRVFNPFLRLLGGVSIVRRAFGSFSYRPDMTEFPQQYRITPFPESVWRTEEALLAGGKNG